MMKTAILLVLGVLVLNACKNTAGSDQDTSATAETSSTPEASNSLVGTWKYDEEYLKSLNDEETRNLLASERYIFEEKQGTVKNQKYIESFEYTINGNELVFKFINVTNADGSNLSKSQYDIYAYAEKTYYFAINDEKLVLGQIAEAVQSGDGSILVKATE